MSCDMCFFSIINLIPCCTQTQGYLTLKPGKRSTTDEHERRGFSLSVGVGERYVNMTHDNMTLFQNQQDSDGCDCREVMVSVPQI